MMRLDRVARRLLLALLFLTGAAQGAAGHPGHAAAPAVGAAILTEPAPSHHPPVHNEATCAFCQASMFQHCAPAAAAAFHGAGAAVRRESVSADERTPHLSAGRPPSSRAPPTLR
jgi:hypothetical protein